MKTIIALVIAGILVVGVALGIQLKSNNQEEGPEFGAFNTPQEILSGTLTSFDRLPLEGVNENTTTTDSALDAGGATITQRVRTEGSQFVRLNMSAVGGTATSTLFIQPWVSYDGLNFFRYSTSTAPETTTTTVSNLTFAYEWDPSTTTSTKSLIWETQGAGYFRFVVWGEDISTDPDDFVKAYIEAIQERQRVKLL